MDDLIGDVQLTSWIRLSGLVRHLHSPLDPPAEAVILGQVHSHLALGPFAPLLLHLHEQRRSVSHGALHGASASFLAELSVSSPRKLFIFII